MSFDVQGMNNTCIQGYVTFFWNQVALTGLLQNDISNKFQFITSLFKESYNIEVTHYISNYIVQLNKL